MSTIGIIAEFNPFHNGHKYFIDKIKKEAGDEATLIGVISSSFVQRGQEAVLTKWDRTRLALDNGLDLVIELPFVFSCQNAEVFAKGAIKTLSLANIDTLYFGSEANNRSALLDICKKISSNKIIVDQYIKRNLASGLSFIVSRNLAYRESNVLSNEEIEIISQPNNILGLEYIKAIDYYNENISVKTIKRTVGHDSDFTKNNFSSASKLRSDYFSNKDIWEFVPFTRSDYKFLKADDDLLLNILKYLFLVENINIKANIEYENGLENRIKDFLPKVDSFDGLVDKVSNKRITKARVRRLIFNALLHLDRAIIFSALEESNYLRILGMNEKGMAHLKTLKTPYVQKFKDFENFDPLTRIIYEIERRASSLYALLTSTPYNLDFITSPIIKKSSL